MFKESSPESLRKEEGYLNLSKGSTEFFTLVDKVSREFRKRSIYRLCLPETMSLYSDIPEWKQTWTLQSIKNITAEEAMTLCLYLPQMNKFFSFELRVELADMCYFKQYEGKWKLIQKLLEVNKLEQMVFILLQKGMKPNELFGKSVKQEVKILSKVRLYDSTKRPVRKPKRKRGYNDHGSRRPDEKWLPTKITSLPNPPKLDFRELMGNSKKSLLNFLFG